EPLDQGVGPGDKVEHHPRPFGVLEVDGDPAPSPAEQGRPPRPARRRAVNGQDLGAQVGQEHGAERPRPDRGQLDHPHSLHRTHARIVGSGGADEGGEAWLTSASTTGGPWGPAPAAGGAGRTPRARAAGGAASPPCWWPPGGPGWSSTISAAPSTAPARRPGRPSGRSRRSRTWGGGPGPTRTGRRPRAGGGGGVDT